MDRAGSRHVFLIAMRFIASRFIARLNSFVNKGNIVRRMLFFQGQPISSSVKRTPDPVETDCFVSHQSASGSITLEVLFGFPIFLCHHGCRLTLTDIREQPAPASLPSRIIYRL